MKVTLVMAQTLDGRIAKNDAHFPDWTGKADKKLFMETTKRARIMVMGRKTFDTIGRALTGRKTVVMTRTPDTAKNAENLEYTNATPEEIFAKAKKDGYDELIIAGGAQINTLWAQAGLINEVLVTVSPLIFGEGPGLFLEGTAMDLKLEETKTIDDNVVLLRYTVIDDSDAT